MQKDLYKKNNNIFQSKDWLSFQSDFGRDIITSKNLSFIKIDLPFKKFGLLSQKSPEKFDLNELKKIGKDNNAIFIRVEPKENINLKELKKITKKSLLSGQASPKATQILDISGSEDEILKNMKPKTRYNIRLAEKKGVKVKVSDNVDVFYELLEKTAKREKGYSPHIKDYYLKMIKNLKDNNFAHIFIAEHDDEPLAGILVSFYGDTAIYLHGGFNDLKRNFMAPYLCQWEAIKYAKSQGCKYYDFWGVAESNDPLDPWAGITRFKEGFGGEKVIFTGTYDIVINKFWYNILTLGAKIKHMVK